MENGEVKQKRQTDSSHLKLAQLRSLVSSNKRKTITLLQKMLIWHMMVRIEMFTFGSEMEFCS